MPTEVIGMYGAANGDTDDALAIVDIPQDGTITGIDWDVRADTPGDSSDLNCELSFIATNQLTTNDVRGRISSVSAEQVLVTSGLSYVSVQKFVGPMDIRVSGGERIYLHVVSTSSSTVSVRCNVHLDTSVIARRSARRR